MSHEPTFASNQQRFWREPLTEVVNVLEIGMSELIHSHNVKDISREQSSKTVCDTARTPLSDTCCDNDSLDAKRIVGFEPSHHKQSSHDARENPQSGVGCISTSLNESRGIAISQDIHS